MWETVVVVAVTVAAVVWVGFKLARTATGKSQCCDGCPTGGCGACKASGLSKTMDPKIGHSSAHRDTLKSR